MPVRMLKLPLSRLRISLQLQKLLLLLRAQRLLLHLNLKKFRDKRPLKLLQARARSLRKIDKSLQRRLLTTV